MADSGRAFAWIATTTMALGVLFDAASNQIGLAYGADNPASILAAGAVSETSSRSTKAELRETKSDVEKLFYLSILFDFDSSTVPQGAILQLRRLAEEARAAGFDNVRQVSITGHADGRGGAAYNVELSKRRAASVKALLVQLGVPADRIATDGLGFDEPLLGNQTPEGRQANRRVEVALAMKEKADIQRAIRVRDRDGTTLWVANAAATLIGAAVGLIAVTIFAVVLRRGSEGSLKEVVKTLFKLSSSLLGAGGGSYLVVEFLLKKGDAMPYYVIACGGTFSALGVLVWYDWWNLTRAR